MSDLFQFFLGSSRIEITYNINKNVCEFETPYSNYKEKLELKLRLIL
ncbi:MAG: hypothetical protein UR52_C0002G0072 [Candidatus Gottesmanbacteria bacterium GW2011_GWA1_34_13]|uniref:Uncharacterized protein n=1 Tax=Candidatus Gottesmanbacteria bacterium GW2011_GWA1_34_13 TaxID=1618434 RepID=A0A0G0ASI0_9BACT|nr:MAG: hypothetical protein UR52_C0002G0072 [Candidatus Gottesmanbacteria bacterium GW2011_GWA1_34_13]